MGSLIAKNPVAKHNYNIIDTIEAGIVLTGTEIKSIRAGKVNLKDAYVNIKNSEAFIYGMHISPYRFSSFIYVNRCPLICLIHFVEIYLTFPLYKVICF